MLRSLHVRNLAVLAESSVEFGDGLNVLTGETGAGKSLVVDSLALLAGARASAELIRTGADRLSVSGVFAPGGEAWRERLEAAGITPQGEELVIRREIGRRSANRVFIDDQPVTLRLLAELAPALLRIHTQQEELGLLSPETQRSWLDRSGGEEAAALRRRVAERYATWGELARRLERAAGDDRLRQERIDLLRFQSAEIDAAGLSAGEEDELRRERAVLRHAEAIREALGGSLELLFEGDGAAVEAVSKSRRRLAEIAEWEPVAAGAAAELEELKIRLEELAASLRGRLEEVEADPARLDRVEERLALLDRLCRKHGLSTAEILSRRAEIGAELEELEGDVRNRAELEAMAAAALDDYRTAADELSAGRRRWAEALCRRVHAELADLALKRARFRVDLGVRARSGSPLRSGGEAIEFSADGYDRVEFLLAANPGEEAGALHRVASGGELSRVYLALQLAVRGEGEAAETSLVFDEVDAGIGGAEAAALGRKLQRLAAGGQILIVTHLPQVASFADRHFQVRKRVVRGRTHTAVDALDAKTRVEEVARMLAGRKVTELSLSHAEELIAASEARR